MEEEEEEERRDKYGLAGVRRLVAGKVHKKSATEKH